MKTNRFGLTQAEVMANRAYMNSLKKVDDIKKFGDSNTYIDCCNFLKKRKKILTRDLKVICESPQYMLRKMATRKKALKTGRGQWEWIG